MEKEVWIKNFGDINAGYHLGTPLLFGGMDYCQELVVGKVIADESITTMQGTYFDGCHFKEEQLNRMIQEIFKTIQTNPQKIKKVHEEAYDLNKKYFEFAKELKKTNLRALNNKQFTEILRTLFELQTKSHQHALATTWFVDSHTSLMSTKLIELLTTIVNATTTKLDPTHAFSVLTTKPANSIAIDEEIESLKIINALDENARALLQEQKTNKQIDELLKKHHAKWAWLTFTYLGPESSKEDILIHWSELAKDSEKKLEEHITRKQTIEKKRRKVFEELNLNAKTIELYDIAAEIVFLKGFRKDCLFHGFHTLDKVFAEVAKRLCVAKNQLHLLTHFEILELLEQNKEPPLSLINARQGYTIMHWKKGVPQILTGEDAKAFIKKVHIKKEIIDESLHELKGTPACPGIASGTVKIINIPEEMNKMEEGDIMVSHTTYPSLVPAMKKAAAIVTEDGGITCHAAIVSREMNTPCITGIKHATKILKDGDTVHVDATEGRVRKENSQNETKLDFKNKEYVRHKRDYSLVATSLVQETYYQKEFIDYFGFVMHPAFIDLHNEDFAHYYAHEDELRRAKEVVEKYTLEDLKKQKEYYDKKNRAYRKLLENPSGDPVEVVTKIHNAFSEFLPFLWGCLDVSQFVSEEENKEILQFANQVRSEYEDFYKAGLVVEKAMFEKIEKEQGIEEKTLYYLTISEWRTFVTSGVLPDIDSTSRRKEFALIRRDVENEQFLKEEEIKDYPFLQKNTTDHSDIKEIKGAVAFPGKVTGTVRKIATIEQVDDVLPGEIIVTGMTCPRYVSALHKAGAIVTDEGGITCHAAIIAREMKKPCIIGTKVATDILQTGDQIEVDATNGIVRRLQ